MIVSRRALIGGAAARRRWHWRALRAARVSARRVTCRARMVGTRI